MRTVIVDDTFVRDVRTSLHAPEKPRVLPEEAFARVLETRVDTAVFVANSVRFLQGDQKKQLYRLWRDHWTEPGHFLEGLKRNKTLFSKIQHKLMYEHETYWGKDAQIEERKLFNERVIPLLEQAASIGWYDVSERYLASGGSVSDEVFVLAEPKFGLDQNEYYRNPGSFALAKREFDMERAIRLIEELRPDILLLDINFPAVMDETAVELFQTRLERLLADGAQVQEEIAPGMFRPIPGYRSFKHSLAEIRRSSGFSRKEGLSNHGGVVLGSALIERGIPFALWTDEFGHGRRGIEDAYVLGLVNRPDVESIVRQVYLGDVRIPRSGRLFIGGKDTSWFDPTDVQRSPMQGERTLEHFDTVLCLAKEAQTSVRY